MNDLDIIKQLMNGNHLNKNELKQAIRVVYELDIGIKTRVEYEQIKPKTNELTKREKQIILYVLKDFEQANYLEKDDYEKELYELTALKNKIKEMMNEWKAD